MARTYHHGDKAKQRAFGKGWLWWNATPKLFRKLHKHTPQRAAQRQALHHVMEGDDGSLFPLDRKPQEYYW